MSLLNNLISYWKLDEASGNAIDSHGSNTLTQVDTPGSAVGKIGNARTVSISDGYFSIADNADLSTGDIDLFFSAWFFPTANPASNRGIFGKWFTIGNQREYLLSHLAPSNQVAFFVSNNGSANTSVTASSFGALSLNQWHYIEAWHNANANEIGVAVNGTENTTAHSTGVFDSTAAFNLGSFNSTGSGAVTGRIDEVGFWKRVLTNDERSALYNNGSGLAYPFAPTIFPRRRRSRSGGGVL
jgi:hypothetical protein